MNAEASPGSQAYLAQLGAEARRTGRPIALDSGPLIDYLSDLEPVSSLLDVILRDPTVDVVLSAITLSEALVRPAQDGNYMQVASLRDAVTFLPAVVVVDFDQAHAIETAFVRAQTRLKLPDAAVVASARRANAFAILGNDRQWRNKPLGVPYHHMDDILALA
ncbi:MAG: PIN domain-containing protein [Thermomicrobiales bacterium]